MAYGGESNAKKLARAEFWNHVYWLRWKDGQHGDDRVLVLAGPEAADIRCLRAVGIDPRQVTAIDTDEASIKSSRQVVPDANYVIGDVFEYVRGEGRGQFDVIFLDFCCTLSPDLIAKTHVATLQGLRKRDGFIGVGAMYGREGRKYQQDPATHKFVPLPKSYQLNKGIPEGRHVGDDVAIAGAGIERTRFVWEAWRTQATRTRLLMTPVLFLSYRSGRRVGTRSVGVPMIYAAFLTRKMKRFQGRKMQSDAGARFEQEVQRTHGACVCVRDIGDDPDGEKVKKSALSWREHSPSERVADFLNLRRQQVAAWLAWETMRARGQSVSVETQPLSDDIIVTQSAEPAAKL